MDETTIIVEIRKGARSLDSFTHRRGDTLSFGRSTDADLVLDSKEISRHHGQVALQKEGFTLRDLSRNGIKTEGENEEGIWLYGSRLLIGPYSIVISLQSEETGKTRKMDIRKRALEKLIEQVDFHKLQCSPKELGPGVEAALDRILFELGENESPKRAQMKVELKDEALGLGPLEKLLAEESVSEIMVVSHDNIYVEEKGKVKKTGLFFSSEESVRTVIDRIVAPLGRRIDESSPMVDARLSDGSRVNAVIPPLAIKGSALTIRKFTSNPLKMEDLVAFGSLDSEMAVFLKEAVKARQNIVISGGTGSGKTTLLNALSAQIDESERIVTIEDAAELQLLQPHVISLESKPPNAEGKGAVTIRDLVKNALRMRPDRIVVGECRGGEALDMLQAMNTGHDGSLTTTHANSPAEALSRLETLALMAGLNLPSRAIREQMANAVDIVIQQSRFSNGKRIIVSIAEVKELKKDGEIELAEIFGFNRKEAENSNLEGFVASGWIPRFMINQGGA